MVDPDRRVAAGGLGASLLLHALVLLFVAETARTAATGGGGAALATTSEPGESGAVLGDTLDIDTADGEPGAGHASPRGAYVPGPLQPAAEPGAPAPPPPAPPPAATTAAAPSPSRPPVAPRPPAPSLPLETAPPPSASAPVAPPPAPSALASAAASGRPAPGATAAPSATASASSLGGAPTAPSLPGSGVASGASAGGRAGSGRVGSLDAPAGYQNLAKAFTRALPAAASPNGGWPKQPLGVLGAWEVRVSVDEAGVLVALDYPDDVPPLVRAMLENTRLLLKAGAFAFWGNTVAGTERVRLEIELSQGEPSEVVRLGHGPPAPDHAGRAYFTLPTGFHFEARVALVASALVEKP